MNGCNALGPRSLARPAFVRISSNYVGSVPNFGILNEKTFLDLQLASERSVDQLFPIACRKILLVDRRKLEHIPDIGMIFQIDRRYHRLIFRSLHRSYLLTLHQQVGTLGRQEEHTYIIFYLLLADSVNFSKMEDFNNNS